MDTNADIPNASDQSAVEAPSSKEPSGRSNWFALLPILALFLGSCVDQPLAPESEVKVDETVTVVPEIITVREEAPVANAQFSFSGRTEYPNSGQRVIVDLSDLVNYRIDVDSTTGMIRLSLSMNGTLPERVQEFNIVEERNGMANEFRLLSGISLYVPTIRFKVGGDLPEIPLIHHPQGVVEGAGPCGGMLIALRPSRTSDDLLGYFTGQTFGCGSNFRQNNGALKIREVADHHIMAELRTEFWIPLPTPGGAVLSRFESKIDLDLEY